MMVTLFTQTWVLAASIDTFNAEDFAARLGAELLLPPPMVAVRVQASSVTAHANILTTHAANSTARVGAALRLFARSPSAAEAALGVTVESIGEPIARELNASQSGGEWQQLLNLTDLDLQGALDSGIGAALVGTDEAAAEVGDDALIAFLVLLGMLAAVALAVAAVVIERRRRRPRPDRAELLHETVDDSAVGKPKGGMGQNELELSGADDARPEHLPAKVTGKGGGRLSVVGLEPV